MTPATAACTTPSKHSSAHADPAPRIIVRIELTPGAKRQLAEAADRLGMTQIAASSRLIEWFAGQPETVQAAVLGQYPAPIEGDVARIVLERMATAGKA